MEGEEMQRGRKTMGNTRELSSVVEFLPQSHNIILPVDHLSKDQNNRNGRETHQQKERVRSLHHIQTLLMSYNLKTKTDRTKRLGLADSILTAILCREPDLHDSYSSVCDC